MILPKIKVLKSHGWQYIPDLNAVELTEEFRGRPVLTPTDDMSDVEAAAKMCPTGAIERKFIEDPYFEYTINEDLCNGCGKCVKGCTSFGNGSLYLQIKQDICVNCNECQIAQVCVSDAISRVNQATAYKLKE